MNYLWTSLCCLIFCCQLSAQSIDVQLLENEIERDELRIQDLQRQIARNEANNNKAANLALEKEIEKIEQGIYAKLEKIQKSEENTPDPNTAELALMKMQEDLNKAEAKIAKLEKENRYLKKKLKSCQQQGSSTTKPRAKDALKEQHMLLVKGGRFNMGCTGEQGGNCFKMELPVHEVRVSDFYISKYELTQKEWKRLMKNNPSEHKCDDCPVTNVSWEDVQRYIGKLKAETGKEFRLPTEAEWEYAARGGQKSKGYRYAGGNSLATVSWYSENAGGKVHAVGKKVANELGLYDMSGNVFEWCADYFLTSYYEKSPSQDPLGPLSLQPKRVLRGGGYAAWPNSCRTAYRFSDNPKQRVYQGGLRLACSL